MTPEETTVTLAKLKDLFEAVTMCRGYIAGLHDSVRYGEDDKAAASATLRDIRVALEEVRSAMLSLSMDLTEGEDDPCGCIRAEDTAQLSGGPIHIPPSEHGDEVAF